MKKVKKTKLSKDKLKKLGSMTLKDKIEAACENTETVEEAAGELRKTMADQEKQSAWGKHQTYLKGNPKESKEVEKMSKGEKGLAAAIYLLKKEEPKFLQVKSTVASNDTLTKGEKWESEKEMLARFSQDEFEVHIASGRIKWRSDPWSYGIYNYCDQGNVKRKWQVTRGNEATLGKEMEVDEDLEGTFQGWEKKDQQTQLAEFENSLLGKGNSKGKALTKGKGKGKGKGSQLAIEDGNVEDEVPEGGEDDWEECLTRMRRCRDLCQAGINHVDESLAKAKATGRVGSKQKKEVEDLLKQGASNVSKLKTLLVKRSKNLTVEEAKKVMLECTQKAKQLKDEKKS